MKQTIKYTMCAATGFAVAMFIWSVEMLDHVTVVSFLAFMLSAAWISMFVYANELHGKD